MNRTLFKGELLSVHYSKSVVLSTLRTLRIPKQIATLFIGEPKTYIFVMFEIKQK